MGENRLYDSSRSMEERIQWLLQEMTLEEKFRFLATRQPALERLGIPAFSFGGEAPHGIEARHDQGNASQPEATTSFSQPIGMSASWDTELIEQVGRIVGTEGRALFNRKKEGGLSRWAPTVDMERDPRWGRTEEGYGEDPLLTGKMAAAYVRGMQGAREDRVLMAASVKHFYANNVEDGRIYKSSTIDPRNKYEYYLEPFRMVVTEGQAEGMMTAYNEINGVPAIVNHEVQEVVKEQWGLRGHVVCDGQDMTQTVDFHHYYETHAETVAEGLKAGIDCFTDDVQEVETAVREAYGRHLITEQDLNRALAHTFGTRIRLGLFDREDPYWKIGEESLNTKEAQRLSLEMAGAGAVLLKNEGGFLPLSETDEVALIGPVGDAWLQDWYGGHPPYRITVREGMASLLGREILFASGLSRVRFRLGEQYVQLDGAGNLRLSAAEEEAVELEWNDWGFGSSTLWAPAVRKFVSLYEEEGRLRADKEAAFGWFVKESFRLESCEEGVRIYGWNGCPVGVDASGWLCPAKEDAAVFQMEVVKDGMAEALRLAAKAEKVIVALGCNPVINSKEEIDRTQLNLPPFQERLVQEIYRSNPQTCLLLLTNYPYAIGWEKENLPAILQMATGSQEMGTAAAALLFGRMCPAGRLPMTWYQSAEELPEMDDYDVIRGKRTYQYGDREPLYPFGYGLSYTSFSYQGLTLTERMPEHTEAGGGIAAEPADRTEAETDGRTMPETAGGVLAGGVPAAGVGARLQARDARIIDVCLQVANRGRCTGDEVVQVYVSYRSGSRIVHPQKKLAAFVRVKALKPGEARTVRLEVPVRDLAVYDVIGERKIVETGEYYFFAGGSSSQEAVGAALWLEGERPEGRNGSRQWPADHYDDCQNAALGAAGGGVSCVRPWKPDQICRMVYRDLLPGTGTRLLLQVRSRKGGRIRACLQQEGSCMEAVWQGKQPDFARTELFFANAGQTPGTEDGHETMPGQAQVQGPGMAADGQRLTLVLELEGDVEVSSLKFAEKTEMTYRTFSEKIKKMPYGGDYNPEQWPEEVWQEDMRLFRLAGIDCVTLNVFSWAALQPNETTYCFEKLDRIMELARQNGLHVILATSTAAHPAWMAMKYPEVLRTEFNGIRRKFGGRHNSCPNSPVFQKYAKRLAQKLAERYQGYDNIVAWHISNEYGGECFCENCEKAFRVWLQEKYGTLEALNRAWNTAFWGHTFYAWEEIVLPNLQSEHFAYERTMFQGISLDYRRFSSDSMLANYRMEYEAVKAVTPDLPVTTNLMGFYKPLDYQKWAKYMDFVSWDNYPSNEEPASAIAMRHDLTRGLKQGAPFVLMEQTPSVTNWLSYNALKRPGVMRLWSYQAVAHGSDSVLFFQMRRSIGACEKYHGAVIDHAGHEYTRVFREVSALGKELGKLGAETLGSRTPAKAAIVVDWDNWWALEYSAGPSCDLKYLEEVQRYYDAFYERNIPVDLISVEDELSSYALVIAPVLYMVKTGFDEKIRSYVRQGGHFVTTFFSGIVNENDLVYPGGYPGVLRDILGIWVEEIDALPKGAGNGFTWEGRHYGCELLCDLLHTERAEALAAYESDFYAGAPALTRNRFGEGCAWYVATRGEKSFYGALIEKLCADSGIAAVWPAIPGVEVTERRRERERYLFFLNHGEESAVIPMEIAGTELLEGRRFAAGERMELPPKGVWIVRTEQDSF